MDMKQMALQLWPCWALGLLMVYLTLASQYRNILRVEPKAIWKFLKFLGIITVLRFFMFKFLTPADTIESVRNVANLIPLGAVLGVFWEDAVHTMPLVLSGLMFAKSKWHKWLYKPAVAMVMMSFASGHIYQGVIPAAAISIYILVSINMGKKYGFGTVMICHMLYDMITLLSMRWMLG